MTDFSADPRLTSQAPGNIASITLKGKYRSHVFKPMLQASINKVEARLRELTYQAAVRMVDYIQEKMAEPKHGRQYTVIINGQLQTYTASAPGEYPAIKTGLLTSESGITITETAKGWAVGTRLYYARELETGEHGIFRPWLSRAVNELGPELKKIITGGGAWKHRTFEPIQAVGTAAGIEMPLLPQ